MHDIHVWPMGIRRNEACVLSVCKEGMSSIMLSHEWEERALHPFVCMFLPYGVCTNGIPISPVEALGLGGMEKYGRSPGNSPF